MWTHLQRVTYPTPEPVTLDEAKRWLRVTGTDDDDVIVEALHAAIAYVDGPNGIGIALMTQQWDLFMDRFPAVIEIPLNPVQSVDEITYVDEDGNTQTLATSVYKVSTNREPAIIERAFGESWPVARLEADAVKVRFTAGYTSRNAIPADLKTAIKWLVSHQYENRTPVVAENMNHLPMSVQALLSRYGSSGIA